MIKQIKKWICRKWGHTFHPLDMLMFRAESRAGMDAQLRCYCCNDMFTLIDLRKITKGLEKDDRNPKDFNPLCDMARDNIP